VESKLKDRFVEGDLLGKNMTSHILFSLIFFDAVLSCYDSHTFCDTDTDLY